MDATIETREQRGTRNIGILNLLMAPMPWLNPTGCVGIDIVVGRVHVIAIVDCGSEDIAAENIAMEMEEEEVGTSFEVDDASGISVPITNVLLPCTMHSRLVLDAQGLGESSERVEGREVGAEFELLFSPWESEVGDADVKGCPSKTKAVERTEAKLVDLLRELVSDDNDVVKEPSVVRTELIFMHSKALPSTQGVESADFHVCE
jgi:hypothetical protein